MTFTAHAGLTDCAIQCACGLRQTPSSPGHPTPAVGATLQFGPQRRQPHGAKLLSLLQGPQAVTANLACAGVAPLLCLVLDEGLEAFPDAIA